MANIDQLDPLLQSLQALKPPGASKTKIASITTLCVENVQVYLRAPHRYSLVAVAHMPSVRINHMSKTLQASQENAWNTQAWSSLCYRLSDTPVD